LFFFKHLFIYSTTRTFIEDTNLHECNYNAVDFNKHSIKHCHKQFRHCSPI